ncbi:MAG: PKD domain-containing protein, partial [Thermodesulfobacteriota bacterium]
MSLMRSLMRLRKKRRAVFQKQNRVFFESLEPRLLLSAAPTAEITTPASVGDWLIVSTASDGKCFYTPVQEGAAFGTTQQFDDKDPTGWSAGIGDFDGDNVLEALVGDNGHTWYFDNDGSGNILEDDSPIDSTFYPGERRDFAEADFNNDGKLEAVMWAEYSTNVTYYKVYGHDGNGNFTLLNTSSTQGNKYIYGMDAADFNNDGKMDFVAGSYSSGAYVYIGNGDLTFQIPTKAITVGNAYGVSAGDFNNDGKADIIFGTRFYKGNGDGTFIYTNDIAFSPYSALAEADIDGDGNLDLLYTGATASGGSNGNNLYYRKGNGNGTFKNPAGNYNPLIHSFGNSINGLAISQKPPKGIWEYNEGATVLFSGTSRDLDVADTLTFHWDWGDGTSTDIPGINDPLNNQIRTGNTSHVYADNGEYLVRLTVTDNESPNNKSSVPAAMSIKIRNAEPTIEAGPDRSVSEGLALSLAPATFNDLGTLDTHTASIDWGDGVVESGSLTEIPFGPPGSTSGANGTISGNHTYGDDGIYTVTVTVTDDDQAMASDSFTVTVANVAPALTLIGEAEINEGSVYTLGLASEDPGTDTISSWTINWGDMTEIVSGNPSSVTHTYADGPVSYTISATATDEDGTYDGSNTVGVTVNNVAPTVDAGPDATIDEGGAFTITGIFSDP